MCGSAVLGMSAWLASSKSHSGATKWCLYILLCRTAIEEKIDEEDDEDALQAERRRKLSLIEPGQWVRAEGIPPLGAGAFGEVYLAQATARAREIAVKDIDMAFVWPEEGASLRDTLIEEHRRFESEVRLMAQLRHPNIVSYLGVDISISQKRLYILMELVTGGSLSSSLAKYGVMAPSTVQDYALDIMEGLHFLHTCSPPIVHRDLKPANVLLTSDGVCKLADFGTARLLEDGAVNRYLSGTPVYAPPEMYDPTSELTTAFDIWSLGATIHELLTRRVPWPREFLSTTNKLIFYLTLLYEDKPPSFDHERLDEHSRAMIVSMLRAEPSERPSILSLSEHAFFQQNYPVPTARNTTYQTRTDVMNKLGRIAEEGHRLSLTTQPSDTSIMSANDRDVIHFKTTK